MNKIYHRKITEEALQGLVAESALEVMIAADIGQDALRYQINHDHFHYDSNAFSSSDAYIESQRQRIRQALSLGENKEAWKAFGRLSHTVQDFYAHSNYVALWLAANERVAHGSEQIDPLDRKILDDPTLHSGKPHFFDLLKYWKLLPTSWEKWISPDSHLAMNIDGPDRPNFDWVFSASVKRTRMEFIQVYDSLSEEQKIDFAGN